jgi:hypothetical protein
MSGSASFQRAKKCCFRFGGIAGHSRKVDRAGNPFVETSTVVAGYPADSWRMIASDQPEFFPIYVVFAA